jgi:hypothetical protein
VASVHEPGLLGLRCSDGCHRRLDAHDVHDAGEVVGQNVEFYRSLDRTPTDIRALSRQH